MGKNKFGNRDAWDCRYDSGANLTVEFAREIAASPYNGNSWAWIKARIQANNTRDIHVADYIPLTLSDGNIFTMEIAGISVYRQSNDAYANNIDFISRELHPTARPWNKASYNNGTSVSPHPWLASDLNAWLNSLQTSVPNATTANPALVAVNYGTSGVLDKFPAALQSMIVPKYLLLPTRYTSGAVLTHDNSIAYVNMGKLWLPAEIEVCGCEIWGGKNGYSGAAFRLYPIFASGEKRIKATAAGVRGGWWLLSASGGISTHCALVSYDGAALGGPGAGAGAASPYYVPVCFRIA